MHGAHGYLIDQFFWEVTNQRTDQYGGDLVSRTRFAADIIQEVRKQGWTRIFRSFSAGRNGNCRISKRNWCELPDELERFLRPLVDAGVDAFHCSTRRFWEPEFAGSDLNLAGWTKKLTGKPAITVGSVTLNEDADDVV
jgi:2,4-dienoyl-CoA reductase-like NADH-dependent reductase (Old Yellow Enzyme family)